MGADDNKPSPVDSSAMRLQSARRLVREPNAPEKLAVIARLQRRYIECRLPKESESRVEQSFNEQLFAKVFGYQTLLSHERLPYHLRPKNYARAVGRYDDFSLGIFWGDERDLVAVTAEFKDPGTDLDAPQTDRREKISAVEQAFRVARGFPSCLSVIVSNFRELRLYRVADQRSPIATFDLHEVRTPRQLAMLCAHFDYDALLGRTGTADMTIALNPSHPSAPIAPTENAFRVICNFTPPPTGLSMPLTILYDAVRETAIELLKVERDEFDRSPKVPITLEDGWVSVETAKVRLAMSAEGQIRCSIRHPRLSGPAQINPDAGFWSIAHDLRDFLRIVERLSAEKTTGLISFELREIRGWQLIFNAQDLLMRDDNTNCGIADGDEILSGDVVWAVGLNAARVAADCMGELALQFKAPNGNRVRFDHAALARHFDELTHRILEGILHAIAESGWFPSEHKIRTQFETDRGAIDRLLEERVIGRIQDGYIISLDGLLRMKSEPQAARELEVCVVLLEMLQKAYRADPNAKVELKQAANELSGSGRATSLSDFRRAALVLQRAANTSNRAELSILYELDGLPKSVGAGDGILNILPTELLG